MFSSRCSCGDNKWENREYLGRPENGVFGSLVGAQWKGRWMVMTEGNVKLVEVTKNETSTCHMSHGANQTINKGLREFFFQRSDSLLNVACRHSLSTLVCEYNELVWSSGFASNLLLKECCPSES